MSQDDIRAMLLVEEYAAMPNMYGQRSVWGATQSPRVSNEELVDKSHKISFDKQPNRTNLFTHTFKLNLCATPTPQCTRSIPGTDQEAHSPISEQCGGIYLEDRRLSD